MTVTAATATASLRAHAAEFHGYWGSGAAIVALVLVLPKDPSAHLLRLLMTVAFFTGVITFLCALLAPLRHYIEARTTVRYQAAGPAILHLARLADAATTQYVATVTLQLVVLVSITAARVLAVWPEFAELAPFASILAIAWWLALLGWFGWLAGAITKGSRVQAVIAESRAGREAIVAKSFVDCTAYGDLAAHAGASYTEPNDYPVVNSMGVGGVNVERFHEYLQSEGAVTQLARGRRSGKEGQIVRVQSNSKGLPKEFRDEAQKIMLAMVTTTVHDDYFMFIKMGFKMPVSPTNRDAVSAAELELRRRQAKAIE